MMHLRSVLAAALVLFAITIPGCGGDGAKPSTSAAESLDPSAGRAQAPAARTASPAAPQEDARPRVVFLGDSLTAGLGLSPEASYPTLVQQKIDADGLGFKVVNAGVSGDTSAGGLSRLDWALDGDVRVLVVALGGNDALRGLQVEELRKNLSTLIERAQAKNIRVVLAGMEAPPNFGQSYIVSFHQVYPDLAKKYGVPLVPFLLQGVAGIELLN